jgi:dipeptidyl aminopeptidase/acylaminoacyl peptidase
MASVTARISLLLLSAALLAPAAGCRSTLKATQPRAETTALDAEGRPTAAAFFRSPLISHPALSPDGKHIAGILESQGVELVFARALAGGQIRPLGKLERTEFRGSKSIRALGWGGNERILVSLESPSTSAVGVRARQTRLMVVALDGSGAKYLGKNWPWQQYSQFQDQIIAWHLPDDADHILMNWWQPDQRGVSARRVDVRSGSLQTEAAAVFGMREWHANHLGQVLAGSGASRSGTDVFTLARITPDERFQELVRFDPYEGSGFEFAAFSERPEQIYVWSSTGTGHAALHTYDLREKLIGPPVFAHPEADAVPAWSSSLDGHLVAVGYVTDRPHWHFVDPAWEREQAAIDRALPGTWNEIVDMDAAERLALVRASSDVAPPRYLVYNRARREMHKLFDPYPDLKSEQMSPMRPIEFQARDGLTIHGYLTRPKDAAPGPLPMIVLPHGGPTSRDVWGWNPEVQFLASRGFAVLQVNFRGSTGYGTKFRRAGYRQWGMAMQDDLTDATRFAIEQGIADPARIGIYGASYGGYAALMALVATPELFRAGASFAGVSDIVAWLDNVDAYAFSDFNAPVHGDTSKDGEQLAATSPARRADRIRAPVLIAHGTEDPIVHVNQAHRMIDALEAAGGQVEFHLYEGEVHGFIDERNEIDFYTKLAAFFERNLLHPRP